MGTAHRIVGTVTLVNSPVTNAIGFIVIKYLLGRKLGTSSKRKGTFICSYSQKIKCWKKKKGYLSPGKH